MRTSPYEVLTEVFVFKNDLKGVFFHWKNKEKSNISISKELYKLKNLC